jgi:hypothetical protein
VRPEVFSGLSALADFTRIEFSGLVLRLLKPKIPETEVQAACRLLNP